jgi:hypothetical protein
VKRLAFIVTVVIVLLIGGAVTAQLAVSGTDSLFITQTTDPDASVMAAASWQAEQLLLFIGFVLFNLVGIAVTITVVMWILHRGVKEVEAAE